MHNPWQHTHFTGRGTEYTDGLNICCNLQILRPLIMYRLLFLFYIALNSLQYIIRLPFVAPKSPSHSDQRLLFTHWVVCIEGHSKSPQTGKEFFLDISEKKLGHESLVILNI